MRWRCRSSCRPSAPCTATTRHTSSPMSAARRSSSRAAPNCWVCRRRTARSRPSKSASAIAFAQDMGVHHVKPGALSLTQATEWGTVYDLAEVSALAAMARRHGLPVHMDGARLCQCAGAPGLHPGGGHLEKRRRCSVAGRDQEWGAVRRGRGVLRSGPGAGLRAPPQAGGAFMVEDEILERAAARVSATWIVARECTPRECHGIGPGPRPAPHRRRLAAAIGGCQRGLRRTARSDRRRLEQQGFGFYRWPLCAAPGGVAIRLVTSYLTPRGARGRVSGGREGCARR